MTKKALLEEVWPECFVEEGILSVHISALRKALGDSGDERRFIETAARVGYRFIGELRKNGVSLSPASIAEERSRSILQNVANPKAYELFGRGRAYLLSAAMTDVPKAVAAFQEAINLEPSYAAAHAGLALAFCAQAELRVAPHSQSYAQARTAALRALALDDSCADAQAALGAVMFLSEWDWVGAERSLRRALDLNPNHTEAYLWLGRLLEAIGRLDEGLRMKQRALERDPFSPHVHLQISLSYWSQRRYDDAIDWANRALAIDPHHLLAQEHLAGSYWKKGDFDKQFQVAVEHARTHGVPAAMLEDLERRYAEGGRQAIVQSTIERLSANSDAFSLHLALLHAEAGKLDAAFDYLDRAIDTRDPSLVQMAIGPQWDSFRGDQRFAERLQRMRLRSS
jgi:tetratricopeptide (TPR) repeat protein